jgi:hypothetical protein
VNAGYGRISLEQLPVDFLAEWGTCRREAVSRTWTKSLLSLDRYQHRRRLVLNEKHDELC